ncbi:hypothetical protein Y032_0091g2429 [Ancylostoma ceylanicum]|uniref:Uncharacterized protein n=1 Tax=Ancylostoma ceylanicum TaxID=53326 RepID=A0A016TM25_9BILA|nr:hypothetical protein Y032_0091g2429 [Ancylostoma ceylanicum]
MHYVDTQTERHDANDAARASGSRPLQSHVQSFSKRWTDCAIAPSRQDLNEGCGESMLLVRGSSRSCRDSAAATLRKRRRNPSIFLRRTVQSIDRTTIGKF